MRFGAQVDVKGIIAPSEDANRAIRYLTKYLTKAVSETYSKHNDPSGEVAEPVVDPAYEAHIDRLHDEVLWLPCSETCANWLRYGIQPKDAGPGLHAGRCPNKAHDRENLGLGGRRVQVSRAWSGKTLTEHKADRSTVVREVLKEAGITAPDADRMAADVLAADGHPRYVWEDIPVGSRDYIHGVMGAVREAQRWRNEYQHAKQQPQQAGERAAARASPDQAVDSAHPAATGRAVETNSATRPPRPPDNPPNQVA